MDYKVFFKEEVKVTEEDVESLNKMLGESFSPANTIDALKTVGKKPTVCPIKDCYFKTGLFFNNQYNCFYLK